MKSIRSKNRWTKGRARRIFDDDVNYDVVGKNAALSFDDSIVERIKLMKDVEDESLVLANDDDASAPRGVFFFFFFFFFFSGRFDRPP